MGFNLMPVSNPTLYPLSACAKDFNVGPKNENKSFIIKVFSVSFGDPGIKLFFLAFSFVKLLKSHELNIFVGKSDSRCLHSGFYMSAAEGIS